MTRIFSPTSYDTDHIVELRNRINADDRALAEVVREARKKDQALCKLYNELLMDRRPAYPRPEHIRGLDQIATMVHEDLPYGDHLGYATEADIAAGRKLPEGVTFNAAVRRINIYANAPIAASGTTWRLWSFTDQEVESLRQHLQQRSLSVASMWIHDDGVGFTVVPIHQ